MSSAVINACEAQRPASVPSLQDTAVIIPTYNAGKHWRKLHAALGYQGIEPEQVLIVDSSSQDETKRLATRAGYKVTVIPKAQFGHGVTRQMALQKVLWAKSLIYLTQDAYPSGSKSFSRLIEVFDDPTIGAVYGRQLPREDADPIERHARLFNYPAASYVRDLSSRKQFGLSTIFFSNSFAAYRRTALEQVGGFPCDAVVSEEVSVAARMLLSGWKIAYAGQATVMHSHRLGVRRQFSRYFDIAAQHQRERWILDAFGTADGRGREFILSELRYLSENGKWLIPAALAADLAKWCGYKLGCREKSLPVWLKRLLSGQPYHWGVRRPQAVPNSRLYSNDRNQVLGS